MKLQFSVKALVLTKKEQEGKEGAKYYKIGVMQGEELGEMSVTEEVFKEVDRGVAYILMVEYNDQYKNIRVYSAMPDTE